MDFDVDQTSRPFSSIAECLQDLQRQLESVSDPVEQMRLLDSFGRYSRYVDKEKTLQSAQRQLKIARTVRDEVWKAKACLRLGVASRLMGDFKAAHDAFNNGWRTLRKYHDKYDEKAELHRELGKVFCDEQGDTRTAERLFQASLEYGELADSGREQALTQLALGEYLYNSGRYDVALEELQKAREEFRSGSMIIELGEEMTLEGLLYLMLHDFETAESVLLESLEHRRNVGNRFGEGNTLQVLGTVHVQSAKPDEALECFRQAVSIFSELDNPLRSGMAQMTIGDVYWGLGQYTLAVQNFEAAEQLLARTDNAVVRGLVIMRKARLMMKVENYAAALAPLESVLEIFRDADLLQEQCEVHLLLAGACEGIGDIQASLEHYKIYLHLSEKILASEVHKKIYEFQFHDTIHRTEDEKESHRARAEEVEPDKEERVKEARTLLLQISRYDEFVEQLRVRLKRMKNSGDGNWNQIDELLARIREGAGNVEALRLFTSELERLDEASLQMLARTCPDLTPAELRVALLLRLNFNNKDIAALLNVSVRTLDAHRRSIRRKLGLNRKEHLGAYLSRL